MGGLKMQGFLYLDAEESVLPFLRVELHCVSPEVEVEIASYEGIGW